MSALDENTVTDLCMVLSTFPTEAKALEVARILVSEHLVACVNLIPKITSVYAWKGQINEETEVLCMMKTEMRLFEQLRARLVALHPYEVPEVVCLKAESVHEPYQQWVSEYVKAGA